MLLALLPVMHGCGAHIDRTRSVIVMSGADGLYNDGQYQAAAAAYGEAAAMNNPAAQYLLGRMYAKGEGVPQDPEKALQWIMKSAEQNYPAAQVDMGLRFLFGDGLSVDHEKAVVHFRRAADKEYVLAMYYLGIVNAYGWGTAASSSEALRWFRIANAYGYPVKEELLTEEGVAAFGAVKPGLPPGLPVDGKRETSTRFFDISCRNDASEIQTRLAELGFYRMRIDGLWGAGSREALRKFQEAVEIEADGEWNMESQEKLFPPTS